MDYQDFALTIIAISVLAGLYLGSGMGIQDIRQAYFTGDRKDMEDNRSQNGSFVLGSAHDHALFHISVNGSELDFSGERFQMNARHVHLENGRSDIVHKHSEGVTWKDFFETVNISIKDNSSRVCVDIYNSTRCGNGTAVLNGEENPDLETEIKQGDNFAVVMGEEVDTLIDNYMKKQLPKAYKPRETRGRRI